MINLASIKRNSLCISVLIVFFLACLLQGNICSGQEQVKLFDLNRDGKTDTITLEPSANSFNLKYETNGKQIEKTVLFFDGFGQGTANMSFGTQKGLLWFSIRFAPKYLDQDTLWFGYDKKKEDWKLVKMASYSFNTMDPRLVSRTCHFTLIQKIWLLKDRYEHVQSLAAVKKNKVNTKCTEKDES